MANVPDSKTTAKDTQQLVFVNLSALAGNDSENVRRLVRSSATRHSHRDPQRKPKSRKASRAKKSSPAESPTLSTVSSTGHSPGEDIGASSKVTQHDNGGPLFSRARREEIASLLQDVATNADCDSTTTQPNNAYPVDPQEWFPWVLSFNRSEYLPAGVKWLELSSSAGAEFVVWYMRQALSEPALFYAQLLWAGAALANEGRLHQHHVEWLRGMVMQSLNHAVGDGRRVMLPSTLIAIALTALHEHVYGDKSVAGGVHGAAFARLLAMHGALSSLRFPNVQWKMLLWIDDVLGGESLDETAQRLIECWVPKKL